MASNDLVWSELGEPLTQEQLVARLDQGSGQPVVVWVVGNHDVLVPLTAGDLGSLAGKVSVPVLAPTPR
jgi:hypothetical protein